jgi:CRISPR/Cas system-associated exonuclease Cas4 (RecB family)
MDSKLRKGLFKVLHEINEIMDGDLIPETKYVLKKCKNCYYNKLCNMNEEDYPEDILY